MMIYSFGEIVLISFPYLDTTKQRPALVILDTGDDDFILAPIAKVKNELFKEIVSLLTVESSKFIKAIMDKTS